jgi:hypothetical protein
MFDDDDDYDVYYLTIPFERFFGNQGFSYVMWSFKVLRNYVLIAVCPIISLCDEIVEVPQSFQKCGISVHGDMNNVSKGTFLAFTHRSEA